jgi:hypothetical protein
LPHYHHIVNIFEVDVSYLPVVIVADMNDPYRMRKYEYEQEEFAVAAMDVSIDGGNDGHVDVQSKQLLESMKAFDFDSMNNFLRQYFEGSLTPTVRSEDIPSPEQSRDPLYKTLVGTNFEQV